MLKRVEVESPVNRNNPITECIPKCLTLDRYRDSVKELIDFLPLALLTETEMIKYEFEVSEMCKANLGKSVYENNPIDFGN